MLLSASERGLSPYGLMLLLLLGVLLTRCEIIMLNKAITARFRIATDLDSYPSLILHFIADWASIATNSWFFQLDTPR